ncbi:unnamed protein product [Heterobilharzia americana]|nr:unnamed protein product [Heterobilharzia americana]CAH8579469.1 unnamed protein product [Heterobilharzia americana]
MSSLIWSGNFWLPPNITWDVIEKVNSVGVAPTLGKSTDCLYVVAFLTAIRHYLKQFVFIPHGLSMGLQIPKPISVPNIPILEEIFVKEKKPSNSRIKELSISLDLSERMIEVWFRKRRNREKSPVIVKFVESEWKLSYYTTMFFYGLISLYQKPYLWDVKEAMANYPYYVMPPEIHWYYMIHLGYYTASLLWIFYEVKRSVSTFNNNDFKVLLGHHIATVSLLAFSYITNHHRIGSLILLLHDIADCWMEAAKICKYVKKHTASEVLFIIFVIIWILTRLTYFPFWVLWAVHKFGTLIRGAYPAHCIMVGFLLVLQALHIYWFYLIVKIAVQLKSQGCNAKDCRSESELSDTSDQQINFDKFQEKNHIKNCNHIDYTLSGKITTEVDNSELNHILHQRFSNHNLSNNGLK